jgi:hypothetical protein
MYKFTVLLLVLGIAFSAQAQKAGNPAPADTAKVQIMPPTDSTGLLNYNDFKELLDKILGDIPAKYSNPISQFLQQRFQERAQQYLQKQTTGKK